MLNNNTDSMLLNNNAYGFKVNINHPVINDLYRRYKAWKGLAVQYPLSDKQRLEFEAYILPKIFSGSIFSEKI